MKSQRIIRNCMGRRMARKIALSLVAVLALFLLSGPRHDVRAHEDGSEDPTPPTSPCDNAGPFGLPGLQLPPDEIGVWGPVMTWPVQATHGSLLPTGKILFWRFGVPTTGYVWNPLDNTMISVPTAGTNLFCSGHATLADGRTIVVGGHFNQNARGLPDTNLFDPVSESWTRVADMAFGRWYPTATALPDGRILAVSGSIKPEDETGPAERATIPEAYDVHTDTWTQLPGADLFLPLYPFDFVLPNGKILYAGPSRTTQTLDLNTQSWQVVGISNFASFAGSAAMYLPGKVLKAGGGNPAIDRAEVLDMTVGSPAWREVAPMAFPRRRPDLVLLPDGTALAVGGSVAGQSAPECAVHAAELWDPATETWTTMASMARTRIYHSTTLLLPDGRVLAAGGENVATAGERNAEIYFPRYLFKGPRPAVNFAPTELSYQEIFRVETGNSRSILSVSLIRPGAVTHNYDENQRYVPLNFEVKGDHLRVTAPENGNMAPPGYYMLFLVNTNGVPSVGRFVKLSAPCSPTGKRERRCTDGLDNDCDGLVDSNDPDCGPPPVCDGDGICEVGEDCGSCQSDCAGRQTGRPADRFCCGDGMAQAAEGDGTICDGNF